MQVPPFPSEAKAGSDVNMLIAAEGKTWYMLLFDSLNTSKDVTKK